MTYLVPARIVDIKDIGETGLLTVEQPTSPDEPSPKTLMLHVEGNAYQRALAEKSLAVGTIAVFVCTLNNMDTGAYKLSVNTDKKGQILFFPPAAYT